MSERDLELVEGDDENESKTETIKRKERLQKEEYIRKCQVRERGRGGRGGEGEVSITVSNL